MSKSPSLSKDKIRQEIKRKRLALTQEYVSSQSEIIQRALIESNEFEKSASIGAYLPANNEVLTQMIIMEATKRGKTVALPKTNQNGIAFFEITDKLVPGKFGILEPLPTNPIPRVDLVLVPGLAFDRQGNRIGYGKGYYDRFLSTHKTFAVGLAYDFQVFDSLPHNKYDAKIQALVSDHFIRF